MLWEEYVSLYNRQQQQTDFLPSEWLDTHTMLSGHLANYVRQKVPAKPGEALPAMLMQGHNVQAHGIYPLHAPAILSSFGFTDISDVGYKSNPRQKEYNFIRPKFFYGYQGQEKTLLSAVVPGRDYLSNHGEMIRHAIRLMGYDPDQRSKIFHYPDVEDRITEWTQLDSNFVKEGDQVILGYVNEMEDRFLKARCPMRRLSEEQNEYQGSRRYQTPIGHNINFLGFKYTYWGDTSAKLAERLCQLGASEIIYTAKTGVLSSPQDIYKRSFSPSAYINVDRDMDKPIIGDLPNALLAIYPELNSGLHASIPTVMEESFTQVGLLRRLLAQSIDNEISQMAGAVRNFNQLWNKAVSFFCLHYGTDYLHGSADSLEKPLFNLYDARSPEALNLKEKALDRNADYLAEYLFRTNFKGQQGLKPVF